MAFKLGASRAAAAGWGTKSACRHGHNTPLPLKRSPPASFKRLLGGTSADCKARCSEGIGECAQVMLGDAVLLKMNTKSHRAERSIEKSVEAWSSRNVQH